MRRRDFTFALGSGTALWPVVTRAQQNAKVFRVGLLGIAQRDETLSRAGYEKLFDTLRDHGFIEGKNLHVRVLSSDGNESRFPQFAAELVAEKVDVIIAVGSAATLAAANATNSIPIVMAAVPNLERLGLVQSLARPGKNVTGLSTMLGDTNRRILDMMMEVLPGRTRIAILANSDNPGSANQLKNWPAVAAEYGLVAISADIRNARELPAALDHFTKQRAEVLWPAPVWWALYSPILEYAAKRLVPVIFAFRQWVPYGALLSYGPDLVDHFRQVALYVVNILNGAKPANLPVQQPTKFHLAINLKTAKALSLTIPESILTQADVIID